MHFVDRLANLLLVSFYYAILCETGLLLRDDGWYAKNGTLILRTKKTYISLPGSQDVTCEVNQASP